MTKQWKRDPSIFYNKHKTYSKLATLFSPRKKNWQGGKVVYNENRSDYE